ncbi:hypothetical protein L3Q82_008591 [Scortum barcoo]|uniref:Uncharacterized protein n=1 Tax=Scortum barcoo TaxID=214431 RepID=A0ACB8XBR1_9TELE|nr:hypothetical protein L3Q82_008591 [Scortum barcoo]
MKLYLKITVCLILLVQAFHLASLQITTDSPGRTIDRSWLRGHPKNTDKSQNAAVTEEETAYYEEADTTTMESNNNYTEVASGSMAENEEGENVTDRERDANATSDDLNVVTTTVPPTFRNITTKQPKLPDASVSPTKATTDPSDSRQVNATGAEKEFRNSTAAPQNSTGFPDYSNHTDLQTTTLAPESNATTEVTTAKPEEENTGMTTDGNTTVTTPVAPEINATSTTSSSTTTFMFETTETSPTATTAAAAPDAPKKLNNTDKAASSGSGSDRGLASNPQRSQRQSAWGAVLGTAVAVVIVGLVAYVILKKKHQKGFSHRKLVEDYPSDPVLRLDNGEPLDLNFGGAAYYNPGPQGDNIQMTNFPGRH